MPNNLYPSKEIGVIKTAISLLEECSIFIDVTCFELGEDWDPDDLEGRIDRFLKENEQFKN